MILQSLHCIKIKIHWELSCFFYILEHNLFLLRIWLRLYPSDNIPQQRS
nr:MAG TPA_asm: hypothetical protein [Caudoviricetes sp.]